MSDEEKANFFRFQDIWRNVLPEACPERFKQLWIRCYPQTNADGTHKHAWTSDASCMGDVFVNGSWEAISVLPGTFTSLHTKKVRVVATDEQGVRGAALAASK